MFLITTIPTFRSTDGASTEPGAPRSSPVGPEVREELMSLVTDAMVVDRQSGKRIQAKLPEQSNGPEPYPRFDRLLAGKNDEGTDIWIDQSVFLFWLWYLNPIGIGDQNSVGNRIRTSTDKMETVSQMVKEWIPKLEQYIKETQKTINTTGATSSQKDSTAYVDTSIFEGSSHNVRPDDNM